MRLPPPKITPKIHRNVGTSFFLGVWQVFPTTSFKLKKKNGEKNVLGFFHIFFINEKNAHVFQQQPKKTRKFRVFSHHQISDDIFIAGKATSEFPPPKSFAASSALHSLSSADLPVVCDSSSHQITMMKLIQIAQKIIYKCKEGQKELFSGQGFPPRFKWSSRVQKERLSPIYP